MKKTIGEVQKTIKLLENQYYETTDPNTKGKIRNKFDSLNTQLEKLIRAQLDSNDPKYQEFAKKLEKSEKQLESLKKELAKYQTIFAYLSDILKGINILIQERE